MHDRQDVVIPGRLSRPAVSREVEGAALQIRPLVAAGGAVMVVDETNTSSAALRKLAEEFGVSITAGWDPDLVNDPAAAANRLASRTARQSHPFREAHVVDTLRRFSNATDRVVLILNPADRSPAATDATRSGARVYMLPRHRTVLPPDAAGEVVPWRRAVDLTPIFLASKPPNYADWRTRYRETTTEDNVVADVPRTPKTLDWPRTVREQPPKRFPGGRLTLNSLSPDPAIRFEQLERLGISIAVLHEPEEWVVGGTMLGPDRALQVTRGHVPDLFNVQLVWGGRDPRPADLLSADADLSEKLEG
jgi:hypothetical protein